MNVADIILAAFDNEMEKIAAELSKEEQKRQMLRTRAVVIGLGGSMAASISFSVAGVPLGHSSLKDFERSTELDFDKVRKAMGVKKGVERISYFQPVFVPTPDKLSPLGRAMTEKVKHPTVALSEPTSAAMAHELGHAKLRQGSLSHVLKWARSPEVGLVGGLGGIVMALGSKKDSKAEKAAPFVAMAPHVPVIAEEAGASLLGDKGLRRVAASPKTLALYRRSLAKGLATYLLAAGAAGGTTYAATKTKHWWLKKRGVAPRENEEVVEKLTNWISKRGKEAA